jgi:hypothetical protein
MSNKRDKTRPGSTGWLLLVHQLPPKPAYLRVKVWRRLQSIGAIALKNSVYALPLNEQAREDFQWLLRDIEQNGGEGLICEAAIVDGMRDDQVRALFDAARDADYNALAKELRALAQIMKRKKGASDEPNAQLAKLRQRFSDINRIDFFGTTGRMTVEGLLSGLEHSLIANAEKKGACGQNCLRLAGAAIHRCQGPFQIRLRQRVCAGTGGNSFRHVRCGIHACGRQMFF